MARILVVGSAVLDLIFTVAHHPAEDEELRASGLRVEPGGNAANTARVLVGLGHEAALGAVLGDHPSGTPLEVGLRVAGVDLAPCRRVPGMPAVSAILLHEGSGNRTIVHHRTTPEYSFDDFARTDLASFRWVHFEARPGPETVRMVRHCRVFRPRMPVSVEVEKPRDGIEECFASARLVVFSRPCAEAAGYREPEALLRAMHAKAPATLFAVTWGGVGAWGIDAAAKVHHAPACPPERVVDTIGAGDTFNAALIGALARRRPFPEALKEGCRLAGRKVGLAGLSGLP